MSVSIPNTSASDTDKTFAGFDFFAAGSLTVANNAVIVKLIHGRQGQIHLSNEVFLPPGIYSITSSPDDPICGIIIRNAVAGHIAQIFGSFSYRGEASISAGAEFTTVLTPSP